MTDGTRDDPALERFVALCAGAPRTEDGRELPPRPSPLRSAGTAGRWPAAERAEIERYLAELRADGLAPSTLARRLAALRALLRPRAAPRQPSRQPCPGDSVSTPRTAAAAHAVAGRGRAARRGRCGHDAARAQGHGARGAPLRRWPQGERGGRPRARRDRPRRAPRSLHRQGREGARRPDRARRRRCDSPLRLSRPAVPRPPSPPGALPQRQGRPAHARRRLLHPPRPRGEGRPRARAASIRTCCAIRSPRICSTGAPTSAASRRCSATRTSPRPSSTRTSRTAAGATPTSTPTPTPRSAGARAVVDFGPRPQGQSLRTWRERATQMRRATAQPSVSSPGITTSAMSQGLSLGHAPSGRI